MTDPRIRADQASNFTPEQVAAAIAARDALPTPTKRRKVQSAALRKAIGQERARQTRARKQQEQGNQ